MVNKAAGAGLALLPWACALLIAGQALATEEPAPDIEVFTRAGCPRCATAKLFLADLQAEQPGLRIVVHDVGKNPDALARLKSLAAQRENSTLGVPAFWLRGDLIVGFTSAATTGARIRALLGRPPPSAGAESLSDACRTETPAPCEAQPAAPGGPIDEIETPLFGRLSVQALGLPLFTFTLGLVDGFNPCSMWVLVFMLSLLAGLQDRFKMLAIAGTFVAVEGLAYFAFMAAWLNAFLLIGLSRISEVILGGIGVLAGAIHVKDAWALHRGVTLSIPESAKPGLYGRLRGILLAEHLGAALAATVILAVFVQAVELLCTAGFPALYTRILTMRQLDWWAYYGYLGLYNVAYMLDDVLVLTVGVITLSQRRLQEKEGRWLKLISGLVMVGLGATLLVKPEWLAW